MRPGLYNINNHLICSWNDLRYQYGFNIENDLQNIEQISAPNGGGLSGILEKNRELKSVKNW